MGTKMDLFSQRHPDKDGDWGGAETGIRCFFLSVSLRVYFCPPFHFVFFLFFFLLFFLIFPIFCLYSPAVSDTEMFAELLCGAVALVLYVNTLGADFCYDDRYLGEWVTSSSGLSSQQHSSDAWLQSLCRSNSEWAASHSTGHIGVYSCELQLYH